MDQLLAVEQWPADDRPRDRHLLLQYAADCWSTRSQTIETFRNVNMNESVRTRWHFCGSQSDTSGRARSTRKRGASDGTCSAAGATDRAKIASTHSSGVRMSIHPSATCFLFPGVTSTGSGPTPAAYENMVLAGDWIDCGLNAGCLEAAVMSGLQAANALSGDPITHRIAGYYMGLGQVDSSDGGGEFGRKTFHMSDEQRGEEAKSVRDLGFQAASEVVERFISSMSRTDPAAADQGESRSPSGQRAAFRQLRADLARAVDANLDLVRRAFDLYAGAVDRLLGSEPSAHDGGEGSHLKLPPVLAGHRASSTLWVHNTTSSASPGPATPRH